MKRLHNLEQLQQAKQSGPLSLIFVKTSSCSVCDAVLPQVEQLLQRYPAISGHLVSLEEVPQVSGELLVFTAPAILLFAEGKEVLRESRFIIFEQLEEQLQTWSEVLG
ncbi:thioredoxin family protein [Ectobacillus ponti]|uniref:Thioredoxin family protein n=1 Tax=Ectobacillus ponti TaxID=2961894 RepID=A0AA41X9Y4_9BACI|nr:thioredoxin family protein [Ectobacillus ponti]MCP8969888.1 thioredoxin family protein [Ectobacillus ponti]